MVLVQFQPRMHALLLLRKYHSVRLCSIANERFDECGSRNSGRKHVGSNWIGDDRNSVGRLRASWNLPHGRIHHAAHKYGNIVILLVDQVKHERVISIELNRAPMLSKTTHQWSNFESCHINWISVQINALIRCGEKRHPTCSRVCHTSSLVDFDTSLMVGLGKFHLLRQGTITDSRQVGLIKQVFNSHLLMKRSEIKVNLYWNVIGARQDYLVQNVRQFTVEFDVKFGQCHVNISMDQISHEFRSSPVGIHDFRFQFTKSVFFVR